MTPDQRRQLDETLQSLAEEWNPEHEDLEVAAKRELRKGLLPAIQSVIHTALWSQDEKQRMTAARYVIDRNLGPLTGANPLTRPMDPLEAMMQGIAVEPPLKGA